MHYKKKQVAVAKYSAKLLQQGLTEEGKAQILKEMKDDGYNDEEIAEITTAVLAGEGTGGGIAESKAAEQKPAMPNDVLDLSRFDYNNLKGLAFKEYNRFVMGLDPEAKFDFIVVKVRAIKKPRYQGVKGTPIDIVGIEVSPVPSTSVTRIPVKFAMAQNGFLQAGDESLGETWFTIVGEQFANNGGNANYMGTYYLLKK